MKDDGLGGTPTSELAFPEQLTAAPTRCPCGATRVADLSRVWRHVPPLVLATCPACGLTAYVPASGDVRLRQHGPCPPASPNLAGD